MFCFPNVEYYEMTRVFVLKVSLICSLKKEGLGPFNPGKVESHSILIKTTAVVILSPPPPSSPVAVLSSWNVNEIVPV